MLELSNISFGYEQGRTVVHDVTLHIKSGEFVAIVGRNGSGKTTLTRLMMSLLKPNSGNILFQGKPTDRFSPADMAHYIGYVFQNPDRQMFLDTVYAEVAYGPGQLGFSKDKMEAAVEEALAITSLCDLAQAYPRTLTKGEKQRVAIASALALQPQMLILDEPTSGQDVWQKEKLMDLLQTLNKKGVTIIMVTHDMNLLVQYVERTIVMSSGTKVFDGKTGELFLIDTDITKWGLNEPPLIHIGRKLLSKYHVQPAASAQELYEHIITIARSEKNA